MMRPQDPIQQLMNSRDLLRRAREAAADVRAAARASKVSVHITDMTPVPAAKYDAGDHVIMKACVEGMARMDDGSIVYRLNANGFPVYVMENQLEGEL